MSNVGMNLEDIVNVLEIALQSVLSEDDVDIVPDEDAQTLDISTDDWTVHLELAPKPLAWLAIDDEPNSAAGYEAARKAKMSVEVEAAFAQANARLEGMLASLLRDSHDPFSRHFASVLDHYEQQSTRA